MNIHFTDTNLKKQLDELTVFQCKVGSHMYGLDNENSDTDYLNIYIEPPYNRNSFMWEHHQLQYKEDCVDYNYTTLQNFIRNIITGDSTINFEVLFSTELKNSNLHWLYRRRFDFVNYDIIKSYLGLAKRDLKMWRRDTRNRHTAETDKKLSHFIRGVTLAAELINCGDIKINCKHTDIELAKLNMLGSDEYKHIIIEDYESSMITLRGQLNELLESGKISKGMNKYSLQALDTEVMNYCELFDEIGNIGRVDYGDLFYKNLMRDIEY